MYKKYKKFFIKFIVIFVALCTLLPIVSDFAIRNFDFIISTFEDKNQLNVNYWINRKLEIAQKKSQKGGKLVFLGGSSILYGINTKEIEDKYKIPVVNFGIHAAYPFITFEYVKQIVNKNDIVIIPLEYRSYTKYYQMHFAKQELEYIFLFDKKLYNSLNKTRKLECIYFFINNLFNVCSKKKIEKTKESFPEYFDSPNSIKYWNDNGDNIYTRIQEKKVIDKMYNEIVKCSGKYYTKEDMEFLKTKDSFLNDFMNFAKDNNIKVIFIAPVLLTNPKKQDVGYYYNIKELWDYIGYDYMDNIDECFYDKKYFYDTNYHLTTEGAKLRTKQIIKLLDKYQIIK